MLINHLLEKKKELSIYSVPAQYLKQKITHGILQGFNLGPLVLMLQLNEFSKDFDLFVRDILFLL